MMPAVVHFPGKYKSYPLNFYYTRLGDLVHERGI